MSIARKEKKYIAKNLSKQSVVEMAVNLKIGAEEIEAYLKKTGKDIGKRKLEEVVTANIWEIIKINKLFLIGLVLGVLLLYANAFHGDFVSDDYASISQNPAISNWAVGLKGLKLVDIANTLIASVFGVSPLPYHLFSIIMFALICALAFVFVYLMLGQNIAVVTTILFAIHPIHVESVSWISGKPYLMYSIFVLLGLISWMLYIRTGKNKYLFWVVVNVVLAFMGEKPRSLSLLLLAGLYLIYDWKNIKNRRGILKALLVGSTVLVVLLGIMWPQVMTRIQSVNSGYNLSDSLFYDPLFQYPTGLAKYLQLMMVPVDLTLYHTMFIFPVWLNWAIFLLYLISILYFFFKNKIIFYCLSFIALAIAPSMAPVKVSWLVAERYAFLGSLGFCMLVAYLVDKTEARLRGFAPVFVLVVGLMLAARTYLRNIDWQTNHKLWVNTVQVSPNSHNAWNNIGDDYDKLQQYENAIKGFSQSTVVKTNYADAYHNRANIYFKTGYLALARDSYETALKFSPGLYQTYLSLTQIDVMEKRYDLALQHSSTAVKLQPENYQSHFVLGWVLAQMGDKAGGIKEMNLALSYNPDFKPARDMLLELSRN